MKTGRNSDNFLMMMYVLIPVHPDHHLLTICGKSQKCLRFGTVIGFGIVPAFLVFLVTVPVSALQQSPNLVR